MPWRPEPGNEGILPSHQEPCAMRHACSRQHLLQRWADLSKRGLQDQKGQLRGASGYYFCNTSRYDFEKLLADAPQLAANLRNCIAGFSENMREVLEKFDFDNTISKLDEAGLLFQVMERFIEDPTGHDADRIAFGSTLSNDRHASQLFDYLIANPPYGKDGKRDQEAVRREHERGATGRFGRELPRISDGQTLLLLRMLARVAGTRD